MSYRATCREIVSVFLMYQVKSLLAPYTTYRLNIERSEVFIPQFYPSTLSLESTPDHLDLSFDSIPQFSRSLRLSCKSESQHLNFKKSKAPTVSISYDFPSPTKSTRCCLINWIVKIPNYSEQRPVVTAILSAGRMAIDFEASHEGSYEAHIRLICPKLT